MANLNIAIQIAAQDEASGPLGRIQGALNGLSGNAQQGFRGLQTLVGAGLVGAAGLGAAAIEAIGTAAFGVANEAATATGMIQAQMGLTAEEAERLGDIAQDVWANNFGANITDAAGAIGLVRQQLGEMSDNELQRATENAFRLSDAFGIETSESILAAKTLMEEFGLSSDEAFDFITTGMQGGLNASDDFLDSIGEYSNLFGDAGFDAGEFFSIMETGAAGGVLGVDKISDAVKEMGIILNEGGDEVSGVFEQIGLDFEAISESVSNGDETWADYFDQIVGGLNEIDDPIERSQAQTALFGTMAEDLGVSFTEGLSAAQTALEDMEGATLSLDSQYDNLGSTVEGMKRRALDAIEPIGGALLDIANEAMPLVDGAFEFFETNIVPMIEAGAEAIGSFVGNLQEGMSPLDAFIEAIWGIAPPGVLDFLVSLRDDVLPGLAAFFTDNVQPVIDMVTQFVSWKDVLGAVGLVVASVVIPALGSILGAVLPVIAVGAVLVGAIALLRNAWEQDWGGIRTFLVEAWENDVKPALEELWAWLQVNVPLALQFLSDYWTGTLLPAITVVADWVTGTLFPLLGDLARWLGETIPPVVQTLADFWTTVLWPAILTVADWVTGTLFPLLGDLAVWLGETIPPIIETLAAFWEETLLPAIEAVWAFITDDLIPLFESLAELVEVTLTLALTVLQGAWENILLPAIEEVWEFIQDNLVPIIDDLIEVLGPPIQSAIGAVTGLFEGFKGGLEGVKGVISDLIGFIDGLIEKLNNIVIPDLLTPGSPTPFEVGLRGIAGALADINGLLPVTNSELNRAGRLRIGALHLVGAGGGASLSGAGSEASLAGADSGPGRRGPWVAAGGQLHVHLNGVTDAAGFLEELGRM